MAAWFARHTLIVLDAARDSQGRWSPHQALCSRVPPTGAAPDSPAAPGRHAMPRIMEFDSTRDRMNPNRIQAIVNGARNYLGGIDWADLHEQWVGARPMTPDGLPHIGALAKHHNVFVVAGRNMLGLSLGPSSGAIAAGLIVGKLRSSDFSAFSPGRFSTVEPG